MLGVLIIGIGFGFFLGCLAGGAIGRTEMLHELGWTWNDFRMRIAYRKQVLSKAAQAMKNPPPVYGRGAQQGSASGMGLGQATPNRKDGA